MPSNIVCGVGINDSTTPVSVNGVKCPYYVSWQGMLKRCYDAKFHAKHPHYIGTTMCDEWLTFSVYRAWMQDQDWEGMHLDKDILVEGNKHYSPKFCVFVSARVNNLFTLSGKTRGKYPLGVNKPHTGDKYRAACCNNTGESVYLGLYATPELAHIAYCEFKYGVVMEVAAEYQQSNPALYSALVLRADNLLSK